MIQQAYDLTKGKERYHALMKRLGVKSELGGKSNLRKFPRFKFDQPEKTILLNILETTCTLNDISVGGLSWMSHRSFTPGTVLKIGFDGTFEVNATVVNVKIMEGAGPDESTLYRMGGTFLSEIEGYNCTVLVLQHLVRIMRSATGQKEEA